MSAAMSALIVGRDLVQRSRMKGVIIDDHDVEIPMSRQSALGPHGHDMHPQEFVRLSGCQDVTARERPAEFEH